MSAHPEADQFLTLKMTTQRAGVGPTTIYRLIKEGTFPRPIKIGCASRWSEREIIEWQKAQKRTRDVIAA